MSRSLAIKKRIGASKLSFIYILAVVIPLFSLLYGWVPVFHKFLYISAIACLLTLLLVPRFYVTRQALLSFFYLTIVVANIMNGDRFAEDKQILDGVMLITSTGIAYYLLESNDVQTKKWIVILVFSILILQTIMSVPIYFARQSAIRNLIEMQYHDQNNFDWNYLYRLGIVSYEMIHALPILIPPIIMWLRKKHLKKGWWIFLLISLVSILALSFMYEATTVQLLALFALVASFIIHKTNKKKSTKRIFFFMALMILFLSSDRVQTNMLDVVEKASLGEISYKAGLIKQDLNNRSEYSDIATRSELYERSLNEFLSSPIWGTDNSDKIGLHSVVFDRMGAFGLIGIVPFIWVMLLVIKYINSLLPPYVNKWYYVICVFCFVSVMIIKGINALEIWLVFCVVSPSLLTMDEKSMINK